jgi:hypothetical protein
VPELRPYPIPVEAKSMAHYIWLAINSLGDMIKSKWAHVRRYPAQMTTYLLLGNKDVGLLLLRDTQTNLDKEIVVELDMAYAELLVQKAERINVHVKRIQDGAPQTSVPPIPWEDSVCGRCQFGHICGQDIKREPMLLVDDPELEAKLVRRGELAPLRKEYDELDEAIKKLFDGKERALIGDWLITGKQIEKVLKAQAERTSTYWQTTIKRLVGKPGAPE